MSAPSLSIAPTLSVVLPNYNGRTLLAANLPNLQAALDAAELPHEILVVDDASTDDSCAVVAALQATLPTLRLLAKPVNEGFASTCNRGIEAARGRLICLVNTDVRFPQDFFQLALPPLLQDQADVVSMRILNFRNGSETPASVTVPIRIQLRHGYVRILRGRQGADGEGIPISMLGCCFLARTDALRALGGYDERYCPYYWEDLDLGLRVRQAGLREVHLDTAEVHHQESSTVKKLDPERLRRVARVRLRNRMLLSWSMVSGPAGWAAQVFWELLYLLTRWTRRGQWHHYPALLDALRLGLQPPRYLRWPRPGALGLDEPGVPERKTG